MKPRLPATAHVTWLQCSRGRRGSEIQNRLWLHRDFETSVGRMTPHLQTNERNHQFSTMTELLYICPVQSSAGRQAWLLASILSLLCIRNQSFKCYLVLMNAFTTWSNGALATTLGRVAVNNSHRASLRIRVSDRRKPSLEKVKIARVSWMINVGPGWASCPHWLHRLSISPGVFHLPGCSAFESSVALTHPSLSASTLPFSMTPLTSNQWVFSSFSL